MRPDTDFWKIRAEKFDKLEWIKRKDFLEAFTKFCRPQKSFIALDLGTGTGIATRSLSARVKKITGIDISPEMIRKAVRAGNIEYQLMNAEGLYFPDESFDLVTARMVFHHIEHLNKAMQEAFRVLKKNRRMALCEGVPPDKSVRQRYVEIFKLKEKRHTFFESDLIDLYKGAGFKDFIVKPYIMKQVSMKNWLHNSGLPNQICRKIVRLHTKTDDNFKRAYNMRINSDDILLDWKFIFISGLK